MSKPDKRSLRYHQDLYTKCRGLVWSAGIDKMDDTDNNIINDAIFLFLLTTLDLFYSVADTTHSHRAINNLLIVIKKQDDIERFVEFLKSADEILINHHCTSYEGFKRLLSQHSLFAGDIISAAKQSITDWFNGYEPATFKKLHTWFLFLTRLSVNRPSCEAAALDQYLSIESNMSYNFDKYDLKSILTNWYPKSLLFSIKEDFRPKHGNGSTADAGKCMFKKYKFLQSDQKIRYLNLGSYGFNDSTIDSVTIRTSKLVFVKKNLKTLRSISMESSTLMWYQQGVLDWFVRDLRTRHRHPLRSRFSPSDQTRNQERAWEGSVDGSYSTIDLSAASDSVSWDMVKDVFSDTCLYKWMLCTRSTHTMLPNGETIALKKFAPMGSALCFPIEVLVFSAIVESVIRDTFTERSLYCVYGDDIIVESELAPIVIERLQYYGFAVNTAKTFCNTDEGPSGFFRESCGGEYLGGYDVTPIRIPRRFSGIHNWTSSSVHVDSLVEFANQVYLDLPSVRRACVSSLLSNDITQRPIFSSDGLRGIFSINPTNYHLKKRWSEPYQHWFCFHHQLKVHYGSGQDENIRYYEYLRAVQRRASLTWPCDLINVDSRAVKGVLPGIGRTPVE